MVNQVMLACDLCVCDLCTRDNPQTHQAPPSLVRPVQYQGTYPGEDWKLDFTQMLPGPGYNIFWYLLKLTHDGLKFSTPDLKR